MIAWPLAKARDPILNNKILNQAKLYRTTRWSTGLYVTTEYLYLP